MRTSVPTIARRPAGERRASHARRAQRAQRGAPLSMGVIGRQQVSACAARVFPHSCSWADGSGDGHTGRPLGRLGSPPSALRLSPRIAPALTPLRFALSKPATKGDGRCRDAAHPEAPARTERLARLARLGLHELRTCASKCDRREPHPPSSPADTTGTLPACGGSPPTFSANTRAACHSCRHGPPPTHDPEVRDSCAANSAAASALAVRSACCRSFSRAVQPHGDQPAELRRQRLS